MPIKTKHTQENVEKFVQKYVDNLFKAVLYYLSYIGEKAVNNARAKGNYKDRTNNLRSSIGYVISYNGKIVKWGDFKKSGNGSEGSGARGVKTGRDLAAEVGEDISRGFCLTLVAGREYAQHVMDRGYDVLQSSEYLANIEANKLVKKIYNSNAH